MIEQARITVTPEFALIDVSREIRIDGFPAYAFITVTATMQMCGAPWRSQAVFMAGHDGSLTWGATARFRAVMPNPRPWASCGPWCAKT